MTGPRSAMPESAARGYRALLATAALSTAALITSVLAVGWADAAPVSAVSVAHPVTTSAVATASAPVLLSVGSGSGQPVAGREYQFYADVTSVRVPAWDIGLDIRLTPGLALAGAAPPGCQPVHGGVACWFAWLDGGQTISLVLNVMVAQSLAAGTQVGISVLLRYDLLGCAQAAISRSVLLPPPPSSPPPSSPPPPSSSSPPPPPSSPPPSLAPSPSPRPRPVPSASTPTAAAAIPPATHPPAARHRKAQPKPRPSPSFFVARPKKPGAPPRPPSPVVPLGILLTAVLIPCVAAAVTRFGKGVHGPGAPPRPH